MKRPTRRFVLGTGATAIGLWLTRRTNSLEAGLRLAQKRSSGPPKDARPAGSTADRSKEQAVAQPKETAPPPWEALAPFQQGEEIAASWSLQELSGVQDGSAVLTLRHGSGKQAQVRLMRRGIVPIGIVQTAKLDLLLMNHARGGEPTDESLARVIRGLAAVIDDHHKAHPAPSRVLASLDAPPSHYC